MSNQETEQEIGFSIPFTKAPNKECGECQVCCGFMRLNEPDFKAEPGRWCPKLEFGVKCTIYNDRPQPCRDFFCGWRAIEGMPEEYRPDKSNFMIVSGTTDDTPDGKIKHFVVMEPVGVRFGKLKKDPLYISAVGLFQKAGLEVWGSDRMNNRYLLGDASKVELNPLNKT